MKKVQEICPHCGETTHRLKKVSKKKAGTAAKGSKRSGYGTFNLPLKCMTCGYLHGGKIVKKKQTHIFIG